MERAADNRKRRRRTVKQTCDRLKTDRREVDSDAFSMEEK